MSSLTRFELREVAVNTPAVTLGEDIRNARQRLQMTQPELAELVGVSESTVSNWERGRSNPKNRLARVREVLKMDTPASGEGPPYTSHETLLREVSDLDLWQEATRRFFGRTLAQGDEHPDRSQLKRGHHAPMPTHLLDPQADERRESDG